MIYKEMKFDLEEMIYLYELKKSKSPQPDSTIVTHEDQIIDPKLC